MQAKTDKPRAVPLTRGALEILNRLQQDAPDEDRIFDPKRTGRKRDCLAAEPLLVLMTLL